VDGEPAPRGAEGAVGARGGTATTGVPVGSSDRTMLVGTAGVVRTEPATAESALAIEGNTDGLEPASLGPGLDGGEGPDVFDNRLAFTRAQGVRAWPWRPKEFTDSRRGACDPKGLLVRLWANPTPQRWLARSSGTHLPQPRSSELARGTAPQYRVSYHRTVTTTASRVRFTRWINAALATATMPSSNATRTPGSFRNMTGPAKA
jgi:hypothetical protein